LSEAVRNLLSIAEFVLKLCGHYVSSLESVQDSILW